MNIRANLTRAKEDNINEVFFLQASQGNQLSVVHPVMTNEEIRKDFLTLAQAMMTQVNQDVGLMVNAIERTMDSILRDFVRMNALIFLGFKVGEDPQEFLDELYIIVNAMGVTSI